MITKSTLNALCMQRQHLIQKTNHDEYEALYRDTSPGHNVYWCGFGDPPSLSFRADFNDIEYNRKRQKSRTLLKGRFQGGNLGWIESNDLELFASLYRKPLEKPTTIQTILLNLIEREGPMNIQLMKEFTGLLVKEITPALHRLQEAFLIYEDQYDGEWDRSWYLFSEMFPHVVLDKYPLKEAIKIILKRFAFRIVFFDVEMVKSFYKLPSKEIKSVIDELIHEEVLREYESGLILTSDFEWLSANTIISPPCVYCLHRNDFLVKTNEHWLKEAFKSDDLDSLQYILIDGEFHGVVLGHFKNGPYLIEDIQLDLQHEQAEIRKDEIVKAVQDVNPHESSRIKKYCGHML